MNVNMDWSGDKAGLDISDCRSYDKTRPKRLVFSSGDGIVEIKLTESGLAYIRKAIESHAELLRKEFLTKIADIEKQAYEAGVPIQEKEAASG